jgi:hypothetical protein
MNRSALSGYNVIFMPFANGRLAGLPRVISAMPQADNNHLVRSSPISSGENGA